MQDTTFGRRSDRLCFRGSLDSALVTALMLGVLSCGRDGESPMAPETGAPLAAAATQTLAFVQVSAGDAHSCGVTSDNRAYCWGWGFYGQLGTGTTDPQSTPAPVAGNLRFRQVSTGGLHTCGVTTDNRAYCWGANGSGELGTGATTDPSLVPTQVAGGRQFRQVSAGEFHSCGVTTENRAFCWGYNGTGGLGDGTDVTRLAPVAVAGGRQYRQVTTGSLYSCGVTTSDVAFCWGWNRDGQLGDSSRAELRLAPSRVAGTRKYRQIDAGAVTTCAVTTTDRAFCWGNGRAGEIGDGKRFLRFWPRAVAGGLSFSRVTVGQLHVCGETTGNRAYCWGYNLNGQLGDGTVTMRLKPVAVAGGSFSQMSAGATHTCGRDPAGVAYCWGEGVNGRLGDGSGTEKHVPTPVAGTN